MGEARHADDTEAPITIKQNEFADWLRKQFPAIELVRIDERNTSQLAAEALYQGGMRKSQRQKKPPPDIGTCERSTGNGGGLKGKGGAGSFFLLGKGRFFPSEIGLTKRKASVFKGNHR